MPGLGKPLIVLGVVLAAPEFLLQVSGNTPWLGRPPGDIRIEREHFSLYLSIATSKLISVVLSLRVWWFRR